MEQDVIVDIVVPVYERAEEVHRFIRQFLSQTFDRFRLIVIDHGRIHVDYSMFCDSRLAVLQESSELWWTGAVNRGIEFALRQTPPSCFLLIINDDVRVATTYLQSLVCLATDWPNAIIGSLSVDEATGEVLSAGFLLNRLTANFVPNYYRCPLDEIPDGCLPSDILPGRGMLVPRGVFERIGLFLETTLPHYGADNEFSYRAKKAGYRLWVSKKCVVETRRAVSLVPSRRKWRVARDCLWGQRSKGNLPMLRALSRCYFRPPYDLYYFLVNAARKVLSTAKYCLR